MYVVFHMRIRFERFRNKSPVPKSGDWGSLFKGLGFAGADIWQLYLLVSIKYTMVENVHCIFYFDDSNTNQKRLFEEAISSARNGKVLYILREELNELPELSQDLSSVNRLYMKMISFLYTKSIESLVESVSSLPEWQNAPCTIILEDLSGYCGKNLQNACGVVAMLIDAIRSCTLALNIPTKLVISVNKHTVGDEYCSILKELYC